MQTLTCVEGIEKFLADRLDESGGNYVPEGAAIRPELAGARIYGGVSVGVASADDVLFESFRGRSVVGPHFMLPGEWMPGASSVVSVFFAFTDAVVKSNISDPDWPSGEWLHGRYEGGLFIADAMAALRDELERAGCDALIPSIDLRFETVEKPEEGKCSGQSYTSNWSERHVAFASGLGTFGLSAGLITKRGMAGRFGSLVTSLKLPPTPRGYSEPFEYCTMCGACVRRCPVDAISKETGKDHVICSTLVDETKRRYPPRYGCGKCQTAVPCQMSAPVGRPK